MNDTSEIAKTESSRSPLAAVIQFVPAALVILRFFMGPLLLLNAIDGKTDAWFMVGFVAAFLSDIFDGVIARRLGVIPFHFEEATLSLNVLLFIPRCLG